MTYRPHVVVGAPNDIDSDARVRKLAVSLDKLGFRVTLLGLGQGATGGVGTRRESRWGDIRVIRLPLGAEIREHRRVRRVLPRPGYRTVDEGRARKLELELRLRDPAHIHRWYGGWYRLWLRARRKLVHTRWVLARRRLKNRTVPPGPRRERLLRLYLALPFLAPWRRVLPEIDDFELAYGPVLDELRPDVIYPHDVFLLGVAVRAAARARRAGRELKVVYDSAEYLPGLPVPPPRSVAAYRNLEREYIRQADRVITVSEPIAAELQRSYRLPRKPDVVLNIPVIGLPPGSGPSVRGAAGVADGVPLLVYSGGLAHSRGVHTVVEALPELPGVHLAVVSRSVSSYMQRLIRRAAELGCAERLHVVPFVPPEHVVAYLSTATVGVVPLLHAPNHDWALTNKFFEYLHARVPILTSDVELQAKLVRELGVGEAFVAGDEHDLARVARQLLADPEQYRQRLAEHPEILREYSWERQEEVLAGVFADLLGGLPEPRDIPAEERERVAAAGPPAPERPLLLGIGPTNNAGQGWEWAKALERAYPAVRTEVTTLVRTAEFAFPTDVRVSPAEWRDERWIAARAREVLGRYTHVLLESGRSILGGRAFELFDHDLPRLLAAGIRVGLIFHGSELRDPRRHRELEPASPFADPDSELSRRLQAGVNQLTPVLERFTGPAFVTTLDLLDYLPDAAWLPVVVDLECWRPGPEPLHRDRPVVVHVPSRGSVKGSAGIDAAAAELDARGVIEYRRLEGVPAEDMPAVLQDADVILDQFAIGDYGVLACEAMASGRIVLGHVADRVRKRLAQQQGAGCSPIDVPVLEATADTLPEVMTRLLDDRAAARAVAGLGREYVRHCHDGKMSASVLAGFLGLGPSTLDGEE